MRVSAGKRDVPIECAINGSRISLTVRANELAIDMLRDRLGLTGTKRSCDVEVCGACTVLIDGRAASACTTLAVEFDEAEVLTIEGLAAPDGTLHPLQRAFVEHGALQCGFCTPGFLMTGYELLCRGVHEREDIRAALDGNICRCTGYVKIMDAIMEAAQCARTRQQEKTE